MTPNIEELITINYELEGLLYLALHRGDDTPQKVWDMIAEKIDSLKSGISETDVNINETEVIPDETSVMPEGKTVEETVAILSETEAATDIPETVSEEASHPEEFQDETVEFRIEDAPAADDTDNEETINEDIIEDEPSMPVEEIQLTEETDHSEIVVEEPREESKATIPVQEPAQELRLEEKLARQNSRNLKKAFSLNDRFRFKRELFDNSDEKMNETLDLVESMRSIEEAHEYFYNTAGLDRTSPDVKDFMDIVEHHISSK